MIQRTFIARVKLGPGDQISLQRILHPMAGYELLSAKCPGEEKSENCDYEL